jgi:glycosyltransferase involved in cell wall biosynthesis
MISVSVIILSYALDDDIYHMNCRCLESLFNSETWREGQLEILLIESNKQNSYSYDNRVKVLVPNEKFNFHRFFNIGLSHTKGEFVAFCNNDIVFGKGWFSAIMDVKKCNPEFMCFSPLDRSYPMMREEILPSCSDFYIGWVNKKHFAAWCFVWERKVFDIIGPFDETFDFYSADDDELQTLRYYAISNVVVTHSEVRHLSQVVTNKVGQQSRYKIEDKECFPLTEEEIRRGYSWLWDDERFYVGYQRMKAKWGNEHMIGRVNRFFERHPSLFVQPITQMMYNRSVNSFLCVLTGIKK